MSEPTKVEENPTPPQQEPSVESLYPLANLRKLQGLRFLAWAALCPLLLWLVSQVAGLYPKGHSYTVIWNQIHYSSFVLQAILMALALWLLWRSSTDPLDDITGLLLFALHLLTSGLLLWRVSGEWMPHVGQQLPSWLLRVGAIAALFLQGILWIGLAWKLGRWGRCYKASLLQQGSLLLLLGGALQSLMTLFFFVQSFFGLALPSFVLQLSRTLPLFSPLLGAGLAFLTWQLSKLEHHQATQHLPASKTPWLRSYLNLHTAYFLMGTQLLLGIVMVTGVFGSQLGRKFQVGRWFATYFPVNSLFLGLLLVWLFWQLARNEETKKANLWFRGTALAMFLTLVCGIASFVLQNKAVAGRLIPSHVLFAPQASATSTLGALLGGVTLLLFLTGLKHLALGMNEFDRSDKVGNLRWVLVGYSIFAPLPVILFAVMATHRRMRIKEGAGAIIPYFIGLCYLIATTTLLLLVFFNISSILQIMHQQLAPTEDVSS
ncbi:MAG: hypothetical protein EP343_28175 [Deltaproteobacteria bacterium]|nr:MAG: hypothetical protein EP343_28175 [Deltaproteobacteria bacterium]